MQQGEAGDEVDRLCGCQPRVLSELAAEDREAIELCDLGGVTQAQSAEWRTERRASPHSGVVVRLQPEAPHLLPQGLARDAERFRAMGHVAAVLLEDHAQIIAFAVHQVIGQRA